MPGSRKEKKMPATRFGDAHRLPSNASKFDHRSSARFGLRTLQTSYCHSCAADISQFLVVSSAFTFVSTLVFRSRRCADFFRDCIQTFSRQYDITEVHVLCVGLTPWISRNAETNYRSCVPPFVDYII